MNQPAITHQIFSKQDWRQWVKQFYRKNPFPQYHSVANRIEIEKKIIFLLFLEYFIFLSSDRHVHWCAYIYLSWPVHLDWLVIIQILRQQKGGWV